MPTCSAKGCFNSSRKGSAMCYFPRNPVRRKKWLDNCTKLGGMHGWKPLESSALCEFHFIKDSWEKLREDGRKKLKCTAVPTLFGVFVKQIKKISPDSSVLVKSKKIPKDQSKKISLKKNLKTRSKIIEIPNEKTISKKCKVVSKNQNKKSIFKNCKKNCTSINKNSSPKKWKQKLEDENKKKISKKKIVIIENQKENNVSEKFKETSDDLNEYDDSKKMEQFTSDLNENSIMEKTKKTFEDSSEKNCIKKLKQSTKKPDKINAVEKSIEILEDLNKDTNSKKFKKTCKILNESLAIEKSEVILKDINKNNIFKTSKKSHENFNSNSRNFQQFSKTLCISSSLDNASESIPKSLTENNTLKEFEENMNKNSKKILEDPDIAKIISQPSPEDKINYSNVLKNKKLQSQEGNETEILIYTLLNKNIEISKSKALSQETKLTAYDLCLNFVDKKTIDKILNENKKPLFENEKDQEPRKINEELSSENFNFLHQEKSLLELQNFYKILEPGLHSEQRCGIMQKMFEKSEQLRKMIEIQFKKKEQIMRNYIKKLKNDLFLSHIKSLGIYSNLHKNQIYFKNGKRNRVRQWNERAIKYAIRLKSSCGATGYEELLKQNFLLPSLRTLRRKKKSIHKNSKIYL